MTAPVWQRLEEDLRRRAGATRFAKRGVDLLLGSDREIGREHHALEKRVGIVPGQVSQLRELFDALNLRLTVYVLAGSGDRAGFSDAAYIEAGAEIVTLDQLEFLDGPPDVVHALKEPSTYEARIPGPYCRIGALHTGDFEPASGLGELLKKGNVAIFDGSNIGASASRRIPIRGRMSVFAGEIAAEWMLDFLARSRARQGEVAIVGGGYAGRAAVEKLTGSDLVGRVRLFDAADRPEQIAALARRYAGEPKVEVRGIGGLDDPRLLAALDAATGLILAVAAPGQRAPKVVHVDSLGRMTDHALVVDISIDERGAILDPLIRDSWTTRQIIPYLEKKVGSHRSHEYRAITNMPRAYPGRASEAHGEVILPYLAALLFVAAEEGGATEVVKRLASLGVEPQNPDPAGVAEHVLEALVQDLRNGLAFWPRRVAEPAHGAGSPPSSTRVVIEPIVADRDRAAGHLFKADVPFEFTLRAGADKESSFSELDELVRSCLLQVQKRGISCTVVCHPGQDGTKTEDAARALGVPEGEVLKCLIVCRAPEHGPEPPLSDFAAVICEGDKHYVSRLLSEAAGGGTWRLATKHEVLRVTGHGLGGISVVEVFDKVERVFVSLGILQKSRVWSSAGSELAGMGLAPRVLRDLGGIVSELTPGDSRVRRHAPEVRRQLAQIDRAIDWDDDELARQSVERLVKVLHD